jgi:putative ABC transport system permease protein
LPRAEPQIASTPAAGGGHLRADFADLPRPPKLREGDYARELLATAAEALSRYKLRTGLSVLGVVLGVAAVIAMMSVSEGARREALAQVELMGLDNVVARNRALTSEEASRFADAGLTAGDSRRLLALVPLVKSASPLVERFMPVSRAGQRTIARVLAVGATYPAILRLRADRGRLLSSVDETTSAKVCVIGADLARLLFGYREPVGDRIRVGSDYYEVVGVLAAQATSAPIIGALAWRDLNQAVLAPLSTVLGRTIEIAPRQPVDEIWMQARDGAQVEAIGEVVRHTLGRLHGAPAFDIVIPRELLAQRYRTQRTFSVVVGSVAVLALVVGGIGIMNIMLTSVVERTKEIGIRRTVGATRRDVSAQFLTESLLMTLTGGTIGIVLGALVSWGITAYAGWSTYISLVAVGLAFGVSVVVGVVFGLYPAVKAARLEPVDAVRYE